jgi:hypothetical protein
VDQGNLVNDEKERLVTDSTPTSTTKLLLWRENALRGRKHQVLCITHLAQVAAAAAISSR